MDDRDERELQLEDDSLAEGYARVLKSRYRQNVGDSEAGHQLLSDALAGLVEAVRAEQAKFEAGGRRDYGLAIVSVESEKLAIIALKSILRSLGRASAEEPRGVPAARISRAIGFFASRQHRQDVLRGRERSVYEAWLKRNQSRNQEKRAREKAEEARTFDWKKGFVDLKLGGLLLDLALRTTGLFEKELRPPKPLVIRFTEKGRKDLQRLLREEEVFVWPFHFPMIRPPVRWTGREGGGYLTLPLPLVKHQDEEDEAAPGSDGADLTIVCEALNTLQETVWRWSAPICELVRGARPEDGLPGFTAEVPPASLREEDAEEGARRAEESHDLTMASRMAILKRLKSEPELWFPYQLDWRGRAYAVPPLIHPQSDDLGRALVEFHRGKPLGERGAFWLAVEVANLYAQDGVDKRPFEGRVRWAEEHRDEIVDSATRPLDGRRFWTRADNPWRFLRAAKEWAGYLSTGPSFVTHVPVAMDGTCNGLQHLSALGRDPEGGRWTNLIPGPGPEDIYQQVADRLKQMLEAMARHEELARAWLELIDRKLVKDATMTTPYGVTEKGIHGQLVGQLTTRLRGRFESVGQAAHYLADMVKIAIDTVVVKAAEIRVWLRSIARILAQRDRGISWVTPAGFSVTHEARKLPERRVETVLCAHVMYEAKGGEPMDVMQQENGVVPHLIHSLDAAHMMFTLRELRARGLGDFAMVHDSYAVHACDVDVMNAVLRDEFVKLHEQFTLATWLDQVRRAAPGVELPAPPEAGRLDLGAVRRSAYFFS